MRLSVPWPGVELLLGSALFDFAEANLVAQAETAGVGEIASFDRSIDRIASVKRREP